MAIPEHLGNNVEQNIPDVENPPSPVDAAYLKHEIDTTAALSERDDSQADKRVEQLESELGISDTKEQTEEQKHVEYAERVLRILNRFDDLMYQRYGNEPFHNPDHIRGFRDDGLDILQRIKEVASELVTEEDELVIPTVAGGHDLVVDYLLNNDPTSFFYGQRMRIRGWEVGDVPPNLKEAVDEEQGGNERKSADETIKILEELDPNGEIYTESARKKVREGIAATYPEAGMAPIAEEHLTIHVSENAEIDLRPYLMKDKEGNYLGLKFNQKYLTPESSISTLASGFADLSYAGKVSGEEFKQLGNAEYRELRELIGSEIKKGIDTISPERKAKIASDMIGWIDTQTGFALHQKIRFNSVINSNNAINAHPKAEMIKNALVGKYRRFDSNIVYAKDRIIAAKEKYASLKDPAAYPGSDELLKELVRDMGYEI
ncbi:MAG: hypothetical protein M3Q73_00280 [bacterium]|nr:hypothetical protein [bacterium]